VDDLVETYIPTKNWLEMDLSLRKKIISTTIGSYSLGTDFDVVSVPDNGQIVLKTSENIAPNVRGLLLLNLEKKLKEDIDIGLTVWLEPVEDKSKLRQLRGVQFN
tara:strand:- start:303 stop:617 length:315 start_codon:yes stop_codon:yes gene_type:complete